jgi:hypothetical protein
MISTLVRALRTLATEALPALLVVYPAALILDDIEPGFVRSFVNPHAFLIALVLIAMLSVQDSSRIHIHQLVVWVGALFIGLWMWWKLGGGALGLFAALLTLIVFVSTVGTTVPTGWSSAYEVFLT